MQVRSKRAGVNGHKLHKGNSVMKIVITVWVVKNWKKMLREAAASLAWEIFST